MLTVLISLCSAILLTLGYRVLHHKLSAKTAGTREDIATLERAFSGAITFLKKARLHKLPRYLVIGYENAGKTSLIAQSQLDFVLAKKFPKHTMLNLPKTPHCDWWVTKDAALLDINGAYIHQANEDPQSATLWHTLLQLIHKHREAKPLQGVVITIDLHHFTESTTAERDQFSQTIRQRLTDLERLSHYPLPITLVFTKCDSIFGFTEFFGALNQTEREQALGIHTQENTPFDTQFDTLIEQLNQQVIWQLHHERSVDKRAKIQAFPLAFQRLKASLTEWIDSLSFTPEASDHINVQGVFFTSSQQTALTIEQHLSPIEESLALTTCDTEYAEHPHRTFFIKGLLTEVIFRSSQHQDRHSARALTRWLPRGVIAAACSIVIVTTGFFAHGFSQAIAAFDHAEDAIAQYQILQRHNPKTPTTIATLLPALNALREAYTQLNQQTLPWALRFGDKHYRHLANATSQLYTQALQRDLLPKIKRYIQLRLTDDTATPRERYGNLQAYLMLAYPKHLDPQFMKNWLGQFTLHNKATLAWQHHMEHLFAHPLPAQLVNTSLIAKNRLALNALDNDQVAYAMIQANSPQTTVSIAHFTGQSDAILQRSFRYVQTETTIPWLYTKEGYAKSYTPLLTKTCDTVLGGNWILGERNLAPATLTQRNQLIAQVNRLYHNNYETHWRTLLKGISLNLPKTFNAAIDTLHALSQPDSSLAKLLQALNQQADLTKQNLSTFNTLNFSPSTINMTLSELGAFTQRLQHVKMADDPNKTAFILAKTRFTDKSHQTAFDKLALNAELLPPPVNRWLKQVNKTVWALLLKNTQVYLNAVWKITVLPHYKNTIEGFYPFNKASEKDLSIEDFTDFFGPQGTLNAFLKTYLAPFINTTQTHWTVRTLDGQGITIDEPSLVQLHRAQIIQQMFFPNGHAPLSVNFTLRPIVMSPQLSAFELHMNNQIIHFRAKSHRRKKIKWPNDRGVQVTELFFKTSHGGSQEMALSGPWAWFRLLDKFHLLTTNDPRHYQLTLDLNGYAAKFELQTRQAINPFIPHIVSEFRCTENLTS